MQVSKYVRNSYALLSIQFWAYGIIFFSSILLNLDLLSHPGIPTTFDGHIHLTTAVQYAQILKGVEIPSWFQGFANYGYPLSLIAHQTSAIFGATLLLLGLSPHIVFKIIILVSTIFSGLGMFWFLQNILQKPVPNEKRVTLTSLGGSLVWTFSHYRIINIYSRGAIPELLVSALLPILLFQMSKSLSKPTARGLALVAVLSALLVLTHPMAIIITMPLLVAIAFSKISLKKSAFSNIFLVTSMIALGILAGAYYLFPLIIETKYFYQGSGASLIELDKFLNWKSASVIQWPYFSLTDHPGPRIGPIPIGIIELGIYLIALVTIILLACKSKSNRALGIWFFAASLSLFLCTPLSAPLYSKLMFLSNLQYPWRFLMSFHFSVSVLATLLHARFRLQKYSILALLIILALTRLPEAYGKNYVNHDVDYYSFTKENLHSTNLNPRWVGETKDYPQQKTLLTVIEGTAEARIIKETASKRSYQVSAEIPSRISFNTFYFPGWTILIDGLEQTVEYQDPSYRGVMTLKIPQGSYRIDLRYKDTKVRFASKLISLIAMGLIGGIYLSSRPALYSNISRLFKKDF